MIYLTSDLHFCHNRSFLWEPRGFENVQEMNQAIVKNWNNIIQPEDEVYVLGDLMLNNDVEGARLFKQLKGQIHVILGNHDTDRRVAAYNTFYNICEICYARPLHYNGYHFFLSHYPTITSNFDYDKPLRSRTLNLCGHSHTPDPFADWDKGLIYHVELDAHNNAPVSLDSIIQDIVNRYNHDPRVLEK